MTVGTLVRARSLRPAPYCSTDAVPLGEALTDLAAWNDLAENAVERSVFSEPAMIGAAAGTIEPDDWMAVRVRGDGDRLDALAVVRRTPSAPLIGPRILETFRSHYGPRNPVLLRAGVTDAADRLVEAMAAQGGVVRLANQALEQPSFQALRRAAERRGGGASTTDVHRRAMLEADRPASEAFGPGLAGRRLHELDRQRRRLGRVEHRLDIEPATVGAALEAFIALEQAGWKGRRGTSLADDGGRLAFARRLVATLSADGRVRADTLLVDSQVAAVVLTLMAGDTGFFWKIAHDPALAKASPGAQVARMASEAMVADPHVRRVDSLATPGHPLVDRLWSGRLTVGTAFLALDAGSIAAADRACEFHRRATHLRDRARRLLGRFSG